MPHSILSFSLVSLLAVSFSCCCLTGITPDSNPTESPAPTPTALPTTFSEPSSPTGSPITDSPVTYDITETVTIRNDGPGSASEINLKVALVRSIAPYQEVVWFNVNPVNYETVTDEYGNVYAGLKITDLAPGESVVVEVSSQVKVNDVSFDIASCQGNVANGDTGAETFIESDAPEIKELAANLAPEQTDRCIQTRAYYDYVIENMQYGGYNPEDSGALSALSNLSGDCTEFSDVLIALNRAGGIPARMLDGVTCCTENGYYESQNKHNWVEVNLPGTGWVPMDATWGRTPGQSEIYFGGVTGDHIIVSMGRNLEMLSNYHYWAYTYSWDDQQPALNATEKWSILKSQ